MGAFLHLGIERGGSGPVTFDNVVLYELVPSIFAGQYRGLAITTLKVTKPAVTNRTSRKATVRINREGRIVILDGTSNIYAGQIFNDGSFEVATGLLEFRAIVARGTATLNKSLRLTVPGVPLRAVDEGFAAVENTVINDLILARDER